MPTLVWQRVRAQRPDREREAQLAIDFSHQERDSCVWLQMEPLQQREWSMCGHSFLRVSGETTYPIRVKADIPRI